MAAYPIKTDRLTLRPPVPGDAARIYACMQDKDLPWNLGRAPMPYTLSDAEHFVAACQDWAKNDQEHAFVICHGTDGLIGCVGLTRKTQTVWEIGYWIAKPFWGRGFASEAACALLDWGRESLGASGFVAGHIADNAGSGHLLGKLGFTPVGTISQFVTGRACHVDAVRMVLDAPAQIALDLPAHEA